MSNFPFLPDKQNSSINGTDIADNMTASLVLIGVMISSLGVMLCWHIKKSEWRNINSEANIESPQNYGIYSREIRERETQTTNNRNRFDSVSSDDGYGSPSSISSVSTASPPQLQLYAIKRKNHPSPLLTMRKTLPTIVETSRENSPRTSFCEEEKTIQQTISMV